MGEMGGLCVCVCVCVCVQLSIRKRVRVFSKGVESVILFLTVLHNNIMCKDI